MRTPGGPCKTENCDVCKYKKYPNGVLLPNCEKCKPDMKDTTEEDNFGNTFNACRPVSKACDLSGCKTCKFIKFGTVQAKNCEECNTGFTI